MLFSQQKLFAYDKGLFQADALEQLFQHGASNAVEHFKLSGLADLRQVLEIQHEWYAEFPRVTIKELSRAVDGQAQPTDSLYREHRRDKARPNTQRVFEIHS